MQKCLQYILTLKFKKTQNFITLKTLVKQLFLEVSRNKNKSQTLCVPHLQHPSQTRSKFFPFNVLIA